MPQMPEPTSSVEAYRAIIDELAFQVAGCGPASHARRAVYSNAPAHRRYNEFLASLTTDQCTLVADMLDDTRSSAIHDVLAALSWWIDCQDVGFTFRGDRMPVDESGMGLQGDYAGRRDGWEWPSEKEEA